MSLEKLLPYYIVDTRSSIESTKTYAEIWYKKAFKRNLVTRHLSDFFFEKKLFWFWKSDFKKVLLKKGLVSKSRNLGQIESINWLRRFWIIRLSQLSSGIGMPCWHQAAWQVGQSGRTPPTKFSVFYFFSTCQEVSFDAYIFIVVNTVLCIFLKQPNSRIRTHIIWDGSSQDHV